MESVVKPQRIQASALESLKRQRRAQELLIQGFTSFQVNETLQAEFKIGRQQAKKYIQKAEKAFIEDNPEDRKALKAKITNMYMDLYQKSYIQQYHRTCREILDSLCKIGGLLEPNQESSAPITINYNLMDKTEESK